MRRAAVVIGVRKAGTLVPLHGAIAGAEKLASWLADEGFEVTRLTDEAAPVTASTVMQAITAFVDAGVYEQLVVYFAGHGFVRGFSEYWLLSGAPRDPNQAIVVNESVDLARQTGIPSVVFISDACRSFARSPADQRVTGSLVFPNPDDTLTDTEVEVDRFFAARVGEAAHELAAAEDSYDGIFTHCLREAFEQPSHTMVREVVVDGERWRVVSNRSLRDYLRNAVPTALRSRGFQVRQRPHAMIESGDQVFLGRAKRVDEAVAPASRPPERSWDQALAGGLESFRGSDDFEPGSFAGDEGFRVEGARVTEVHALGCAARRHDADVYVNAQKRPRSVVLEFEGGTGTVLPALPRYYGVVRVENGRVASVTYQPSRRTVNGIEYGERNAELRRLQSAVEDATRRGEFQISRAEAREFANRIRVMKLVDPTLGLYAVYAYAACGDLDQIVSVEQFMSYDIFGRLYDVALLAGERPGPGDDDLAPFVPVLSQGWTYLRSRRGTIPPAAERAEKYLLDALWTTFSAEGMAILLEAVKKGELR
ncbi:caspase family protein [Nannocystis radixulma]|uniref:Caspase family protein n=1 Tax=Nannocystis radixulma TaxID=2995305 RepID=A0ABT5BS90_9BACT|nr:caspase family protein [Nannocystis radixulma]MDC0675786.1 caspase family protein [Nannocystis radixulma]